MLCKFVQSAAHDINTDIKKMKASKRQCTFFIVPLLCLSTVEVLWELRPMHSCIVVMDDMLPVVEGSPINKRIDAIVGQGIVALWSRWIYKDVLRPISEAHGQEGNEDWKHEYPERCPEVDELGQACNNSCPNDDTSKCGTQPFPALRFYAIDG